MGNIEKFKRIHYYCGDRELTADEASKMGICADPVNGDYFSLEDRAYQAAYDISNDWLKEEPEWKDVQEGFRRGVKEGIEYCQEQVEKYLAGIVDKDIITGLKQLIDYNIKKI